MIQYLISRIADSQITVINPVVFDKTAFAGQSVNSTLIEKGNSDSEFISKAQTKVHVEIGFSFLFC